MTFGSARLVAVVIGFSEADARESGWGRFGELSAADARLTTTSELKRHDRLFLTFEAAGEKFKSLPALVTHAEIDGEGSVSAEIRFTDEVEKRRLSRTLLDILSR